MPKPTGYCTVAEIRAIFRAAQDVIKIGPATEDNLTETQVEEYIYKVERRIDARLSFKYSIPFAVPPDDIISQITCRRSAYDIYVDIYPSRQWEVLPEAVKEWKGLADGLLDDIISGQILLTVPVAAGTGIRAMTSHLKRAREIEVRLTGTDWICLGYEFIIPDSFIASRSTDESFPSLDTYILGTDFEMLWQEGYMRRVSGSSIPISSVVYLYFLYQETPEYQKGIREESELEEGGYL